MKIFEAFAGIGSINKAYKNLGIHNETVGISEINKYAIKSYYAIHGHIENYGDIKILNPLILPKYKLLYHGSPCQDFSNAGRGAGGEKGSGTRSSLLWDTLDIAFWTKPKYIVWENVEGILNKKNIIVFNKYLKYLEELGYSNSYEILDARDYGIPQRRKRVITISVLNGLAINFTNLEKLPQRELIEFLEQNIDIEKYRIKGDRAAKLLVCDDLDNIKILNNTKKGYLPAELYDGIVSNQLTGGGVNNTGSRGRVQKKSIPTIQCNKESVAVIIPDPDNKEKVILRYLTPLERYRLMGFDDKDYKATNEAGISENQQYILTGNSVVVPMNEAIVKLIEKREKEDGRNTNKN